MNYTEQLEKWFQLAKSEGRVLDIKFFPGIDPDGSREKLARAAYETLTGKRELRTTTSADTADPAW